MLKFLTGRQWREIHNPKAPTNGNTLMTVIEKATEEITEAAPKVFDALLNIFSLIVAKGVNSGFLLEFIVLGFLYPLQKAWYFDRIYRIYRMLTLRYILSILLILSNNF